MSEYIVWTMTAETGTKCLHSKSLMHQVVINRAQHVAEFGHEQVPQTENTDVYSMRGVVVSVLATGSKVRGFKPSRGRWIFKGDKTP
jgi:hypothetical protein